MGSRSHRACRRRGRALIWSSAGVMAPAIAIVVAPGHQHSPWADPKRHRRPRAGHAQDTRDTKKTQNRGLSRTPPDKTGQPLPQVKAGFCDGRSSKTTPLRGFDSRHLQECFGREPARQSIVGGAPALAGHGWTQNRSHRAGEEVGRRGGQLIWPRPIQLEVPAPLASSSVRHPTVVRVKRSRFSLRG